MIDSLYDCFKHWSKTGSVYIISDTHFDDADCKIMNKDWISPEEHINILSKVAHKSDTLIILGDIGNPKYLKKIKAHKVLIKGNHDSGSLNYKDYFNEIYSGPLFISEKIILSHERVELPFAFNIHGHEHNGKPYSCNNGCYSMNVASDVVNFEPINLSLIIKSGVLNKVNNIHRITIDKATKNPIHKK